MTLYSGGGGESDRSVGIAFRHVEPPHQVVGTLTDPGCRYISTILTTWVLCQEQSSYMDSRNCSFVRRVQQEILVATIRASEGYW